MKIVKIIHKEIGKWIWIPLVKYYLSNERNLIINTIAIKVPVGVFHPTLFKSTKFLLNYIESKNVNGLKVLELGAGAGLLSIALAKNGANVTASDISETACNAVVENAKKNQVLVTVIKSDLFDSFEAQKFEMILINPPYYPKNPNTESEYAWYCGEHYDYFRRLFLRLALFIDQNGFAIMVLSEDCNIDRISQIAVKQHFLWRQIAKKKIGLEWNYLFKITLIGS